MKFADVLRRLDAYPRTLDDFSVRTVGGAAGGCRCTIDCGVKEPKQPAFL